jgi:hypothetical protein
MEQCFTGIGEPCLRNSGFNQREQFSRARRSARRNSVLRASAEPVFYGTVVLPALISGNGVLRLIMEQRFHGTAFYGQRRARFTEHHMPYVSTRNRVSLLNSVFTVNGGNSYRHQQ